MEKIFKLKFGESQDFKCDGNFKVKVMDNYTVITFDTECVVPEKKQMCSCNGTGKALYWNCPECCEHIY